jgi:hypothetical protein
MPLDLAHLLRLRLAIARFGEMDGAQWWNTKGILGRVGAMAWPWNLPHTHAFARACRRTGELVPYWADGWRSSRCARRAG